MWKNQLKLMAFVRQYWGWLSLAFICLMASTAFSLIVPTILSQAINDLVNKTDPGFLITAAVYVVGAAALRGIFGYGSSYLTESVSQKTAYGIRNAIYDRLQRLSFAYHDKTQTGQLMSRATEDVEAVRRFVSIGILGLIQTIILFIAIAVILMVLNWQLALITLFFIILIAVRAITVSRGLRRIWLRIQQLFGELTTVLEENLTGIRVVKAFSQQGAESRKFTIQASQLYNEELYVDREIAFNIPLLVFIIGLPSVIILWYGGKQVIAGNLTLGGLTQFIFYLGILAMPVRRLGFISTLLSRSVSAGQRVLEILERESPVQEKTGAVSLNGIKGEVRFDNVSFSYDSMGQVLKNVSFTAKPGELVALVGSSGSGKSTIANLIPRFYDAGIGRITIDGTDVRDIALTSLRKHIGIVQQDIFLFSTTIRENIAYGAVRASMEEIEAAAQAAHLDDFIRNLPDGYETLVGERGITLSGGEKQRVAIARTILTNPRILILDDSTSSVDAETEHAIRHALDQLVKGRTTFIITHRLPVIRNASLILVLKDGEIVQQGTHPELMSVEGLYKNIYESQISVDEGCEPDPGEE
jgi:ABC-type multidrug transport system fused ATPase/permease subunit